MSKVICFDSEEAWVEGVTSAIAARLRAALADRAQATILLAGGSTPSPVYQALAQTEGVDWSRVHFFWGDERHVPPNHEKSNFRMVRETLLKPLGISSDDPRVHWVPTRSATPREDASLYEQNLRLFFHLMPGEAPRFDVVLLGMGSDGHTASLFPNTEALDEYEHLVVANPVSKLDSTRITVTFPVLNAARSIFILVRGEEKAPRLATVLEGASAQYPVQRISPVNGELIWMVDKAAASELSEPPPGC
ncbi:MAG: 6-phosphogluconolactonase [Chloroflexota bacterium]|nr:6-phosphogluconolactonase [Chloroflexota bacterium]